MAISSCQFSYAGKRLYTTEFLHKPYSVAWCQAMSIYLHYVTNRSFKCFKITLIKISKYLSCGFSSKTCVVN